MPSPQESWDARSAYVLKQHAWKGSIRTALDKFHLYSAAQAAAEHAEWQVHKALIEAKVLAQ